MLEADITSGPFSGEAILRLQWTDVLFFHQIAFHFPPVIQNSQRGETVCKPGNQPPLESKSKSDFWDAGEATFYKVPAQVPEWSDFMRVRFPSSCGSDWSSWSSSGSSAWTTLLVCHWWSWLDGSLLWSEAGHVLFCLRTVFDLKSILSGIIQPPLVS